MIRNIPGLVKNALRNSNVYADGGPIDKLRDRHIAGDSNELICLMRI